MIWRFIRSTCITVASWITITAGVAWALLGTSAFSAKASNLSQVFRDGGISAAFSDAWSTPAFLQAGIITAAILLIYQLVLLYVCMTLLEHAEARCSQIVPD